MFKFAAAFNQPVNFITSSVTNMDGEGRLWALRFVRVANHLFCNVLDLFAWPPMRG